MLFVGIPISTLNFESYNVKILLSEMLNVPQSL